MKMMKRWQSWFLASSLISSFATQTNAVFQHMHHGHRVRAVCPHDPAPWPQQRLEGMRLGEDGEDWDNPVAIEFFENPPFLARLRQLHVFEPTRDAPPFDISMVSALSLARVDALQRQCTAWPGTMSAALYVPIIRASRNRFRVEPSHAYLHPFLHDTLNLAAMTAYIKGVHAAIQNEGACGLLLSVWIEELPANYLEGNINPIWDYPTNSIRNRAMLQAPTELVVLADVDFVPGPFPEVHRVLHNVEAYREITTSLRDNAVGTFANFAPEGEGVEQHKTMQRVYDAQSKADIAALFDSSALSVFQESNHQHTDYERWFKTNETYEVAYTCWDVTSNAYYEPFVIGWKDMLPVFDERFRGYMGNKNVWMVALTALYRYPLRVIPNMYLVHTPHTYTAGMAPWDTRFIHIKRAYLQEACKEGAKGVEYPFVLLDADEEVCQQGLMNQNRRMQLEIL